jgi:hypothetical protein
VLPAGSPNSGTLTLGTSRSRTQADHQSVPQPRKSCLRPIARSLCFSGRTGAFVPYDDAWGTQGWEISPSHCLLDSPNDAFPEVGIWGEKGKAVGFWRRRLCCLGHAPHTSSIGAAAKLLTRDQARRIAANVAKVPQLLRRTPSRASAAWPCRLSDRITTKLLQCMSPLVAQSGHADCAAECPLLGVKRTSTGANPMSAFDPKRTLARCAKLTI